MKKLLKDTHPHLLNEIHPSKNGHIDLSNLYENSSVKIYWQCPIKQDHIYCQPISRRSKQGYGCPYCSGRLTLREDSFAALYPKVADELHPTKNKGFDPYKYRPLSDKKVWWRCKNGHEWQQKISARVKGSVCRKCRRQENSLASKYPELALEWHPTKNGNLKAVDVLVYHKQQVWWQCIKNPLHEWKALIRSRIESKTGCPECHKENKSNTEYPTLEEYDQFLSQQWHPRKNGAIKPYDVKANSSLKVWWVCPIDATHEWPARINHRSLLGRGCPKCSRSYVSEKNSFIKLFPNIAKQWHPTKNGTLKPSDVSYGSARRVWWKCLDVESHEWEATITSRTTTGDETCRICKMEKNSLETVYPDIAQQWHPTKNGDLTPSDVSQAGGRKVWWLCPQNPDHEWKAIIKNRTVLKSGCPWCAEEKNALRLRERLFDIANSDISNYHVFISQIKTISQFLNISFKDSHRMVQPFYRMLFASIITALETYLSDLFTVKILNDESLIEKLILSDPKLNSRKYSPKEVIAWVKDAKGKITEYLFTILWHNFDRAKLLYEEVLSVQFPDSIGHLYSAVDVRHDIVHRNGRKKGGGLHSLSKRQIEKLISDVRDFVDYLNNQIEKT